MGHRWVCYSCRLRCPKTVHSGNGLPLLALRHLVSLLVSQCWAPWRRHQLSRISAFTSTSRFQWSRMPGSVRRRATFTCVASVNFAGSWTETPCLRLSVRWSSDDWTTVMVSSPAARRPLFIVSSVCRTPPPDWRMYISRICGEETPGRIASKFCLIIGT